MSEVLCFPEVLIIHAVSHQAAGTQLQRGAGPGVGSAMELCRGFSLLMGHPTRVGSGAWCLPLAQLPGLLGSSFPHGVPLLSLCILGHHGRCGGLVLLVVGCSQQPCSCRRHSTRAAVSRCVQTAPLPAQHLHCLPWVPVVPDPCCEICPLGFAISLPMEWF